MSTLKQKISLTKDGRILDVLRQEVFPGSNAFSRNAWKQLFKNGWVQNEFDQKIRLTSRLKPGTNVFIKIPCTKIGLLAQSYQPLQILAENKNWIAVAKPEKIPSYPRFPWEENTFVNYVAGYLEQNNLLNSEDFASLGPYPKLEAGLTHRLDNDTSGVLLVALNHDCKKKVREAFTQHRVEKVYLASVLNQWKEGIIRKKFFFQKKNNTTIEVVENSSNEILGEAIFEIEKICSNEKYSLIKIKTSGGIRHQVRVVMAYLGFPLVGDIRYQNEKQRLQNPTTIDYHQLHAYSIKLEGIDDETINVKAPLPASFLCNLEKLGLYYKEQ